MATSPPRGCARFVDSSRRATKQVAWNAVGRSNQLSFKNVCGSYAHASPRVLARWFDDVDDVSVLARAGAARHFKNLSSLLLDYGQLKYSQPLVAGHHHIGNPLRVIAITGYPGWSNVSRMCIATRRSRANQVLDGAEQVLGLGTFG